MKRLWTEEEKQELAERFPNERLGLIARKMGRSFSSICKKAWELGLYAKLKRNLQPISVTTAEAAYMAGFIDADGCIRLSAVRLYGNYIRAVPIVEISNSRRGIIDWVASRVRTSGRWDTRGVYKAEESRYCKQKWPHYHLSITGKERVKGLLTAILPYLIVKRKQAERVIAFIDSRLSRPQGRHQKMIPDEWRLVLQVYELNASRKKPHIESRERLRAFVESL